MDKPTSNMSRDLSDVKTQLAQLGVRRDVQLQQLEQYGQAVFKWNKAFNLISRRDIRRFAKRHILDSLTANSLLQPGTVLDFGSGAGLPGVVLAIANPEQNYVLLDRSARRVRFLRHVAHQIGLPNVEVVEQSLAANDVWSTANQGRFSNITSRAVLSLSLLWKLTQPLLSETGQVIAYAAIHSIQQQEADSNLSSLQQELGAMVGVADCTSHLIDLDSKQMLLVRQTKTEPAVNTQETKHTLHTLVQMRKATTS